MSSTIRLTTAALAPLSLALAACTGAPTVLTGVGIAATEITADSAIIWSRASAPGTMTVTVKGPHGAVVTGKATLARDSDYTGQVAIGGLAAATDYRYRVTLHATGDSPLTMDGRFRTAPPAKASSALQFGFGADLAGQNICRDATAGFPILAAIDQLQFDFFIALGDIIYADERCEATGALGNAQLAGDFGRAETLDEFHAHWRYSLSDAGMRRLRARTGYYAVWDDHEVVNDFGPGNDRRGENGPALMAPGLRAFLNYNAVATASEKRLYRRFRHGANAEFFLLDTRSYRHHNEQADSADNPKSMLGAAQANWLVDGVASSTAIWKFVVSSVPMSLPTGWPRDKGRDGWANGAGPTGFENELIGLLRTFQKAGVRNLVWLSADVHFATGFQYTPFADDPEFKVYEFIAGPLNAGLFPTQEVDATLAPRRLYFHGPAAVGATHSFDEAIGWFNLGHVRVSESGLLTLSVIDGHGTAVHSLELAPEGAAF